MARGSIIYYGQGGGGASASGPQPTFNIMDYYQPGDGAPTVDGLTTKNIGPAFGRAYAATVGAHKHLTLWIPPCDAYGVQAWSWEEQQSISVVTDDLWTLEVVGSGQAGIIIPTQIGGLSDKLSVNGGGPSGQPMRFLYRNMFWRGDSTKTDDCLSVLNTSTDESVTVEDCYFYGLQAASTGLLILDSNDLQVRDVNFANCGNSALGGDAALISFYGCVFPASFDHVFIFPSEHRDALTNPVGPLGEAAFSKTNAAPCWGIWPRGDDPAHGPLVKLRQCVFGDVSFGAVKGDPDLAGPNFIVESIEFDQCVFHSSVHCAIKAFQNVSRVKLTDCLIEHNSAGVPSVLMADPTCELLVLERNHATHNLIQFRAQQSGQRVVVRNNKGGDLDVTGAAHVVVDEDSTFDIFAGATIERCLRGTSAAGATVNLADDGALEYQIPATSSFTLHIEILGSRTDAQGNARDVYEVSGHSDGATVTVDDVAPVTTTGGIAAAGWSAPAFSGTGLALRIACAGVAGQTVDFEAHVTGRSRPGHN